MKATYVWLSGYGLRTGHAFSETAIWGLPYKALTPLCGRKPPPFGWEEPRGIAPKRQCATCRRAIESMEEHEQDH